MVAAVSAAVAFGCLAGAALLLRSLGHRFRIGRLLAAAPSVSIDEARELAAGPPVYVKVHGRITSDEEFPDEHDRPLVFRRARIQLGTGRARWRTVFDEREAVPFGVETRSSFITVDETALTDGLVAIPREAAGRAADLPTAWTDALPDGHDPQAPARLVIEQLSAVEHATVCGQPALRDGQAVMTAGLGRPLIVTTLEAPAAMRVLASGHRGRVAAAALLLVAAFGAAGVAIVALVVGL